MSSGDLFDVISTETDGTPHMGAHTPLAVRMRPATLQEVVGQAHILHDGSPVRRLINPPELGHTLTVPGSVILWGPPGTGKTTIAYLIARNAGHRFVELSAVSAGVRDVRQVIEEARRHLVSGRETVLFIDEVHRFSKSQQDALLPSVENRWVTLIAATTENPSFSVNSPLLSRSLLVTLEPLTNGDIHDLVDRAIQDPRGLANTVRLDPLAQEHIVRMAGGDARRALTILEAAAGAVVADKGDRDSANLTIDISMVEQAMTTAVVRYDRTDQHYDVTSAFIKSMRGSHVDAALHYLARMLSAGEDPRFIARRIVIAAAEEVGMADPSALQTAMAAAQAVAMIGMPEARIILSQAVIHVATAPKSNASYKAINAALADIDTGRSGLVPSHLRDGHYAGAERLGHGVGYRYAHDEPHAVVRQQYLPDELEGAQYYHPSDRGFERQISERLAKVRSILGEEDLRPGG